MIPMCAAGEPLNAAHGERTRDRQVVQDTLIVDLQTAGLVPAIQDDPQLIPSFSFIFARKALAPA